VVQERIWSLGTICKSLGFEEYKVGQRLGTLFPRVRRRGSRKDEGSQRGYLTGEVMEGSYSSSRTPPYQEEKEAGNCLFAGTGSVYSSKKRGGQRQRETCAGGLARNNTKAEEVPLLPTGPATEKGLGKETRGRNQQSRVNERLRGRGSEESGSLYAIKN